MPWEGRRLGMRLWAALYLTLWLVLGEFLLAMIPVFPSVFPSLHLLLGGGLIGVTYWNFRELRATTAPGRIKRVARASFQLSIVTAALGVPLFFSFGVGWPLPLLGFSVFQVILFFHVLNAFAIITQVAATAIAYDMWEEHEFSTGTLPGEIPPLTPARGPTTTSR